MGYTRNEYDWCVMKGIIDDKQHTIIRHVYDLKKSHVEPAVFFRFLSDIDAEYGKIAKITSKRGKVNKLLGMTIY